MQKSVVIPWTIGFLIMGALMGVLLIMSLYFATQLYLDYQYIAGVDFARELAAIRLQVTLLTERWAANRYLASGDPAARAEAEAARALSDRDMTILQDATESGRWDALAASIQRYHTLLDGLLYYSNGTQVEKQAFIDDADDALIQVLRTLSAIEADLQEQVRAALERYHRFFQQRFRVVLGMGLWLIFAGAVTGLTLGRSFTRPLSRLTEAARRLGQGDLTAEPEEALAPPGASSGNEIGALSTSFRQMAHSLRLAIERMRETATALAGSSARLSTSAAYLNNLAGGTRAQMEQIAQGAEVQREQMRVATQVTQGLAIALQRSAEQAAEAGGAARGAQSRLEHTARTMAALDREAAEIQTITAVIEQFAQETHMLSLNASIEARRAGEMGRGFAAVSDEMRALAERSARSAGEVTRFGARVQAEIESVGQAVVQVQEAVDQTALFARQTADTAHQQEQETATLTTVVKQAAAVSDDQARIASQVSRSAAEQADTIAELANAASELSRLVNQLESLAARFATHSAADGDRPSAELS